MERKTLVKGKTNIYFFQNTSPYYALFEKSELIVEKNGIALELNFPSFQTNLNLNQDGNYILENIINFKRIEIDDLFFFKNFVKTIVVNSENFDKESFKVIFNLPNVVQTLYFKLSSNSNKLIFEKN